MTDRSSSDTREALISVAASLAAAISLLERTPKAKKAAPSDMMFEQMLTDYRASLEDARTTIRTLDAAQAPTDAFLTARVSELEKALREIAEIGGTITDPRNVYGIKMNNIACATLAGLARTAARAIPGVAQAQRIEELEGALRDALCELSALALQVGVRPGGSVQRAQIRARAALPERNGDGPSVSSTDREGK